jgi:hypothetical protein
LVMPRSSRTGGILRLLKERRRWELPGAAVEW